MKVGARPPLFWALVFICIAGTVPNAGSVHYAGSPRITAIHDVSQPLRDVVGRWRTGHSARARAATPAAALPQAGAATGLTMVNDFAGVASPDGSTEEFPADSTGAAGADHYMMAVNFSAGIYSRGGTLIESFATGAFWDGFAPCGGGWADAIVLYDKAAERWVVTRTVPEKFDEQPFTNWYTCFAVSKDSDPTGEYFRYAFLIDPTELNDYPKFGVWHDAYYMTGDRDKIFPGKGVFVAAFERSKMLAGEAAQGLLATIDNGGKRAGMLPADWDGDTPPPAGSPNYLVRTLDTNLGWASRALEVWQFAINWETPGGTLSVMNTLLPDDFNSKLCDLAQDCIPQKDTTRGLDPVAGGRPMYRLAYRNFGNHEALVFNQTVVAGATNHAGVRWYELRRTGGPWSIHQQNTFAPDETSRFIGSVAMDRFGNILAGYSVSGQNTFPGIRVAGRLATSPANTLFDETTLKDGAGAQTGFVFWADYSHLSLDPLDDCTLWYVNAYQPTTTDKQGWATHVGTFRFPECKTDVEVTKVRAVGSPSTVQAGDTVTYTITVKNKGSVHAGNVSLIDSVPDDTSFVSLTAPTGWTCVHPDVGDDGSILCSTRRMGPNESAVFTVKVQVSCSVADGTTIGNKAITGLGTPLDENLDNNVSATSFAVDNPAPVITASLGASLLPQNNHEMIDVGLNVTVTDGAFCSAGPLTIQVFGDEDDESPTAPKDVFSPDAKDIAVKTLRLRQERRNSGNGRVYLIVLKSTDQANATGFSTLTVTVPKSSSDANIAAVIAEAAATAAYANAHAGAPPPGYFVIGNGPVIGVKQ